MQLADYIRTRREERQQSQTDLALAAGVNRNTVTNLESGKALRFATVAQVLRGMGYHDDSSAMREAALLWLEQVSGVHFSRAQPAELLDEMIRRDTVELEPLLAALGAVIREQGLGPEEVKRLMWAVQSAPALEVLRILHATAGPSGPQ